MEVRLSNRIRLMNPPEVLKDYLVEQLKLPNPKYIDAKKNGYSVWKIPEFITNFSILPDESMYIPRGYKTELFRLIKAFNIPNVVVKDDRFVSEHIHVDSTQIKLRDYQSRALGTLINTADEGLLVAPAGSGKTIMGLSLLPILGQKMLWLTHTGPLAEQVADRVKLFFPELGPEDVGRIGDGKWAIGKALTISMVQTLVRRPEECYAMRNEFGIVVVDEAHHHPSTTFTQVTNSFAAKYMYGLTATHERRDGLHHLMYQTLGPVLHEVPRKEVHGIIVPEIICRRLPFPVRSDDFQEILAELLDHKERNSLIINDVLTEAHNNNICVVVTDRKEHAEILYAGIKAYWGKTGIATGNYTKKQIQQTIKDLEDKKISVLITTSALLGEGFDHAPINRGFMCLPFRNAVKTEQIVGRVQRTSVGKEDAKIYDYVDEHSLLKHQFHNEGPYGCRLKVYAKLGCKIKYM